MKPVTWRGVLALALPSMASAVLTNAYRSVDQFWIQDVSVEAQAAIGSSFFILIAVYAVFQLTGMGAAPLIARATGAGDDALRRRILSTAILGTTGLYVLVAVLLAPISLQIAESMGLSGQTAEECSTYLSVLFITGLPFALTPLVDQCFVATGDTRTPMWLQGLSLAVNFVLTPLFIFTFDLGIAGAALASNGSRLLTTGLGLWLLMRATGLSREDLGPSGLDAVQLRRMVAIGAPASAGILLYAGVYWGVLKTSVSPLGPEVNAALGIGFSALEGFTWPAFHGVSLAVSSIVGRALGAGQVDQAWRAIKLGVPMSGVLGLLATAAFIGLGGPLTGIFTDDPLVQQEATTYAFVLGFSQIFVAYEALTEGVLNGAGDTKGVFWWSVPLNLLRIPGAWFLAIHLGWGAAGIWWAINATTWVKTVGKGFWVWRGGWARLDV